MHDREKNRMPLTTGQIVGIVALALFVLFVMIMIARTKPKRVHVSYPESNINQPRMAYLRSGNEFYPIDLTSTVQMISNAFGNATYDNQTQQIKVTHGNETQAINVFYEPIGNVSADRIKTIGLFEETVDIPTLA